MSTDEIRNQKALALLEFKEAEDEVNRLEAERKKLAADLRDFAATLDKIPEGMLATFGEKYSRLTPDAVYTLLSKLQESKRKLAEARDKKFQFGL